MPICGHPWTSVLVLQVWGVLSAVLPVPAKEFNTLQAIPPRRGSATRSPGNVGPWVSITSSSKIHPELEGQSMKRTFGRCARGLAESRGIPPSAR